MQHSHHEESCHLTKWSCGFRSHILGAKTFFFMGLAFEKPPLFFQVLEIPPRFSIYKKLGFLPLPLISTGISMLVYPIRYQASPLEACRSSQALDRFADLLMASSAAP